MLNLILKPNLTDTKSLRLGIFMFGSVALLLLAGSIFMPAFTQKDIKVKYNGQVVEVIPNTDPRFHQNELELRIFMAGSGVVFGLFAVLSYQTARKTKGK